MFSGWMMVEMSVVSNMFRKDVSVCGCFFNYGHLFVLLIHFKYPPPPHTLAMDTHSEDYL